MLGLKIKFFCSAYDRPGWARYQHTSVVLAEGLQTLNIPYSGNIDYWFNGKEYLIKKDADEKPADLNIYSSHFLNDYPEEINKVDYSRINVLMDNEDGFDTPCMEHRFEKFDLILRCHYNKKFELFKNGMYWATDKRPDYLPQTKPWNFGMSTRMMDSVDRYKDLPLEGKVLCNFRMGHNIREWGVNNFNEILDKQYEIYNNVTDVLVDESPEADDLSFWSQTGRRHNEQYFKDINLSKYTYAFGGKLFEDPINNSNKLEVLRLQMLKGIAFVSRRLGMAPTEHKFMTLTQYGGWRFLESLMSNTVPIQVNLDYWGARWPETPISKVHYWGVDGFQFKKSAEELLNLSEEKLQGLVKDGREWVIKHYSPEAVANRLISHINEINK